MGIIVRQGIFNALFSYVGAAIGFVLTLIIYPQILTTEQYGLTRVLLSISILAVQFATLGTRSSMVKYFPYFKESKDESTFTLFFSLTHLLGYAVIIAVFYVFKDALLGYFIEESPLLSSYFDLLLPLIFFNLFFTFFTSYARVYHSTVVPSFINDIVLRVLIIALLYSYFFGWIDFQLFIYLFVGLYGIVMLALGMYLIVALRPKISFSTILPNLKIRGDIIRYSMYAFLGGITTVIIGRIDIIMLSSLTGLSDTGIYSIAFYIGAVIAIPVRALDKISFPIIADAFKANNMEEVQTIYRKSSINQLIAGSLLYIGVCANLHNLMNILPPEYQGGEWVVVIIGFAYLFDMATGVNGAILISSKYYRYDLYINLALVIAAITLNVLLIPMYGIIGAAIATTTSIFSYNTFKYLFIRFKLGMSPFGKETLQLVVLAGSILALNFLFEPMQSLFADLILRSVIMALVFGIGVYTLKLSEDANRVINKFLNKLN